jgi:hypothetical protein
MLNVYSGTVRLGARGRATVRLPRYFQAANGDYRYQLTPVGRPAPDLHVARRIAGNRFTIAGGRPGLTVCWQVSGLRQDAWAKANRLHAEPLKRRADRGRYLHPGLYGEPATKGIHWLDGDAAPRLRKPKPGKAVRIPEPATSARSGSQPATGRARRAEPIEEQAHRLRAQLGRMNGPVNGGNGNGHGANGHNGNGYNGHRHNGGGPLANGIPVARATAEAHATVPVGS